MHGSVPQFGRIMDEPGIEMFPASSPQTKGRIERLWETLQSRLVTEFRIVIVNKKVPKMSEKIHIHISLACVSKVLVRPHPVCRGKYIIIGID